MPYRLATRVTSTARTRTVKALGAVVGLVVAVGVVAGPAAATRPPDIRFAESPEACTLPADSAETAGGWISAYQVRGFPSLRTPDGEVLAGSNRNFGYWRELANGTYVVITGEVETEVTIACPQPQNYAPEAEPETFGNGEEELPYEITIAAADLLANDSDIDGDALIVTEWSTGRVRTGTISIDDRGTPGDLNDDLLTYHRPDHPLAFCFPNDAFLYRVADGRGGVHGAWVQLDVFPFDPWCFDLGG